MLNYDTLKKFEQTISEYTGAPYVVLTDCCTHALELCFRYKNPGPVICPAHTYVSIPMMLYKLNIPFYYDHEPWEYEYRFAPSNIWDSARAFDKGMYRAGALQCLSFGNSKRLDLKRGGAILTSNREDYIALKKMAYDGRDLDITPWYSQASFEIGYHYKMDLETAQQGIEKLTQGQLADKKSQLINYPDCSILNVTRR